VAPPVLVAPRVDLSVPAPTQLCYVPRKVVQFTEEAMILPGPVMKRWNAGRYMYGIGTGLTSAATTAAGIGGIIIAAGGSTASTSDPGPAFSLAGSIGNMSATGFLVTGLALQHSALSMIGKDSGRTKFIAGVVFGLLGLASVGTGYVLGSVDIPNKDIINYAVGYGGTALLTAASGILINDSKNLKLIWDSLGMRPAVPSPYGGLPPGSAPYPPSQMPAPYPQQPSAFPAPR
jgi:hypothetical protein